MKVVIKDRLLSPNEFYGLTEHERKVINCFKNTTRINFLRSDLIYLKMMIKRATPEQICAIIYKAQKDKVNRMEEGLEDNFSDFKYLYEWVMRMNLRKKNKK